MANIISMFMLRRAFFSSLGVDRVGPTVA
jgi:hypothetical protein